MSSFVKRGGREACDRVVCLAQEGNADDGGDAAESTDNDEYVLEADGLGDEPAGYRADDGTQERTERVQRHSGRSFFLREEVADSASTARNGRTPHKSTYRDTIRMIKRTDGDA